jgi:hypothetical protein
MGDVRATDYPLALFEFCTTCIIYLLHLLIHYDNTSKQSAQQTLLHGPLCLAVSIPGTVPTIFK